MGALSPLFLIAAVSVAVPLFLHLFHRQQVRRLSFPALRYLERTEREHARQIRFRQLLLLLLRVAVLLVLVGAGARLFLLGRGAAHPPTAVVIILDNSMSTGRVVGGERVLDQIRSHALRTLDRASPEDRVWVILAGEPWRPVTPLAPSEARRFVQEALPTDARGDLTAALERAAALLRTAPLRPREIHLLSDVQRTAFDPARAAPAGDVPVVVWAPDEAPENRGLARVLVGGGLPPLAGERTEVTVEATPGPEGDTTRLPVRVVMDGRVRGAATVSLGATAAIPLPPVPSGWITGWVETEPDDLRADDRRNFAFQARPAPVVTLRGEPGSFVREAAAVLEAAGRIRLTATGAATLLVSGHGEGLEGAGAGAVVVVPPEDPTLLPALNRRLSAAGIPWVYERRDEQGRAAVVGTRLPEPLEDVTADQWYGLSVRNAPATPPRVLAQVAGEPWLVEGTDAAGRHYLLLASALDATSSSLPVSAAMVRFVDWAAGAWAGSGGAMPDVLAGQPLDAPRGADRVRLPSGEETEVDGTRMVRATATAGLYTFLVGDSVIEVVAVNPDPAESDLSPLTRAALPGALSRDIVVVDRPAAWDRAVFRERQGPELWWPLLVLAALMLVAESLLAAPGRGDRRDVLRPVTPQAPAGD